MPRYGMPCPSAYGGQPFTDIRNRSPRAGLGPKNRWLVPFCELLRMRRHKVAQYVVDFTENPVEVQRFAPPRSPAMQQDAKQPNYIDLAADIVSAFVSKNSIPVAELPALIQNVHAALNKTAQGITEPAKEDLHPAVSIKKSVTPDYLICLEDGKRFKSLKRHLRTKYELTPDQYRARWNSRATIRWSLPIMLRRGHSWRRAWVWGRSALPRGSGRGRLHEIAPGMGRPLDTRLHVDGLRRIALSSLQRGPACDGPQRRVSTAYLALT